MDGVESLISCQKVTGMSMAEKAAFSCLLSLCLWVNLFQKQPNNRLFSAHLLKIQVVAVQEMPSLLEGVTGRI